MLLPDPRRSLVRAHIIRLLGSHVFERDLGRILDGGPGIPEGGRSGPIRFAEACFFSYGRLPKGAMPAEDLVVAPEIIFEFKVRGEPWHKVLSRVVAYLDVSVVLVCIIDADRRSIRVYSGDHPEQVLSDGDHLTLVPVFNDLCIPISQLFAWPVSS